MTTNEAYEKGRRDFQLGYPPIMNPYPYGSKNYADWRQGWQGAWEK